MKRALAFGLATLVVAGCGSHDTRFGDLRVVARAPIDVRTTPRPRFDGPGPDLRDVAFLSDRVGIVTATKRLQRTTDGGDTWHDVWTGRGAANVSWVSAGPAGHAVAGGVDAAGFPCCSSAGISAARGRRCVRGCRT